MRVVINQSNYLPWKGYFDLMHDADVFVFYDDVQFTKNDWRNRNLIKTAGGPLWLSVPVGRSLSRRICDVVIAHDAWQRTHWKSLRQWYGRAPFFDRYRPWLEHVYLERRWERLSALNQALTRWMAGELGVAVRFMDSTELLPPCGSGQRRILQLLTGLGADHYISGPAGRAYLDEQAFAAAGIRLTWKDYSGYPEYPQFFPPFEHHVSALDLLFHTGPAAAEFVWGRRQRAAAPALEVL
jgi:hypothetical protein